MYGNWAGAGVPGSIYSKNEFLKLYRKKKKFMLILTSHLKLQKLQLQGMISA